MTFLRLLYPVFPFPRGIKFSEAGTEIVDIGPVLRQWLTRVLSLPEQDGEWSAGRCVSVPNVEIYQLQV